MAHMPHTVNRSSPRGPPKWRLSKPNPSPQNGTALSVVEARAIPRAGQMPPRLCSHLGQLNGITLHGSCSVGRLATDIWHPRDTRYLAPLSLWLSMPG